jgi:16S rRNA G966 N2-methylase RsmD
VAHEALRAIGRNAQAVLKDDLDKRARIFRADYRSAIGQLNGMTFDLVFLDPPYRMTEAYPNALMLLRAVGALNKDCWIIMERAREAEISLPEGFERFDVRSYGATSVEFVREAAR